MREKPKIAVLAFLLLLLAGCSSWDKAKKEAFEPSGTVIEPGADRALHILPEPDKMVYNAKDQEGMAVKFISFSERYLYCMMPVIENSAIAAEIAAISELVEVKILVDKAQSFDCENTCIPKKQSKINLLISSDVAVKRNNVQSNYCVNEYGVLLTSNSFNDAGSLTDSVIIYSEDLGDLYKEHFAEAWD